MNKKIFTFDLDGTLLTHKNTIHPESLLALDKAKELGHINVINTGRGLLKSLPVLELSSSLDYAICSNGSLIYDKINQKHYTIAKMDKFAFEQLINFAKENNFPLTIDTLNFNGTFLPQNKIPKFVYEQAIMDLGKINLVSEDKLLKIINDKDQTITQMALRASNERAQQTFQYFQKIFKNKYSVMLTNGIYIDINALGVSKYNGVFELAKRLDIDPDNIYAFGDSDNDLSMLDQARNSYCLANGTINAKEVAKNTIGHCNTGTIGQTINEILKNEINNN
ncbi:Cof-type HAD-IIB family hydrolase [Mycoplasmopsis opalescens]|uniref:Cof-type HAD-IIB family hydrolase n=1 Tax=Mycoplasmopsis opalescens TaxID=114886 RepID=UPI0004A70B8A|nr:Cof-type HAD-IIB family hydrolase [Mycoplasmopsis opalescens]